MLGLAFAKYGQLKKDEIEKKAAKTPLYAKDKEEAKLQHVLNNDSDMARLYRETYHDIKVDKEADEIEANRVYEKYAYLYDKDKPHFTKYSEQYDLTQHKSDDDDIYSTEMSDPESDLLYKRYKAWISDN